MGIKSTNLFIIESEVTDEVGIKSDKQVGGKGGYSVKKVSSCYRNIAVMTRQATNYYIKIIIKIRKYGTLYLRKR